MSDQTGRATHGRDPHGETVIMRQNNERSRVVVDGKRTDDDTLCKLVTVDEVGGTWAFYPHGWGTFGFRLSRAAAREVARVILVGGARVSTSIPTLPVGVSHLLVADDALSDGHQSGTYVATCGALQASLAPSSRPPQRDGLYCPQCVREAARWSAPGGAR